MPGAGHIVHMPAHIYYRTGLYKESLEVNKRAMAVDEQYFKTSPSDPMYKSAYYPHNIHFVLVSAQMGGDGNAAIAAAQKLDASMAPEVVAQFPIMQPVKAAPYTTHAQFSAPDTILALPAPAPGLVLVDTMYHYARAIAFAQKKDFASAQKEIDALAAIEKDADYKPFEEWGIPAKEIVQTARLVAGGRMADAKGDLEGAARAYEDAVFIEDTLTYTEPPYWYYPIRQSLAAALLQAGRYAEAERQFQRALTRAPSSGWSYYGLAQLHKARGNTTAARKAEADLARTWIGDRRLLQISNL
jgi:tetratricopeptide (TPR) repeat protein